MSLDRKIQKLTIKGFKSIRFLENFEMRDINVLIGANGSGKSNFISYFRMLRELAEGRLRVWVAKQGGANRILTYGLKESQKLESEIFFSPHWYKFVLEPVVDGGLLFLEDKIEHESGYKMGLTTGEYESSLSRERDQLLEYNHILREAYDIISAWRIFHFHDTSDFARVKQSETLYDNAYLRPDAANLAPYLYKLRHEYPHVYQQIRDVVQLAMPFFDDFVLEPQSLASSEQVIKLAWRQKNTDYPFEVFLLSDGSLRFICLATALLQPNPPPLIVIDEPELGLHPYAISLLGALVRSASVHTQIILATHSVKLLNEFELEDLIIVEREDGVSTFKRRDAKDFELWLEEYTIGELWEKNVLGGRP
jgi:predicted ATPase